MLIENLASDPNPITPGDSVGPYIFKHNRKNLETLNTRAYVIQHKYIGRKSNESGRKTAKTTSQVFIPFFMFFSRLCPVSWNKQRASK